MIKGLIFDFGNVIGTFDNNIFLEKISKYSPYSVDALDEIIYKESGLPKQYESGVISSDEFFDEVKTCCLLEMPKDKFREAYTQIFTPIPETIDLIKRLKKNEYRLGLLSDTSEWDSEDGVKQMDIYPLFDAVTFSFEVKATKPHPKIYMASLKEIKLLPEECAYVDDIKEYAEIFSRLGGYGIHYTSHDPLVGELKELEVVID